MTYRSCVTCRRTVWTCGESALIGVGLAPGPGGVYVGLGVFAAWYRVLLSSCFAAVDNPLLKLLPVGFPFGGGVYAGAYGLEAADEPDSEEYDLPVGFDDVAGGV